VALVYIAAFAPDKGESVNSLIGGFPAGGPQPPILPPRDGYLFLDPGKFHASFCADVPADQAAFMAASQVPWGVDAAARFSRRLAMVPRSVTVPPSADTSIAPVPVCGSQESSAATSRQLVVRHGRDAMVCAPPIPWSRSTSKTIR
jgi:hypothetical protein